jgi:hypothetical protein
MRLSVTMGILAATTGVAAADDIGGTVVDSATGAAVAGALVAADEITAESGTDGSFLLAGVPGARVAVFVFADGYAPTEAELSARVPGRIELHRDTAAVEIIEVSGKAPDEAAPTSYSFNRDQIRALPGTGNDVLRALQSMPGVSRMAYGIGGLMLRGASPHESSIYLDGIEVPLAYHFGGVSSFYPSTLLDEVTLSPGGADVAFGRAVGGVVELKSRGPRDALGLGGELGVFDASVYGDAPVGAGGVTLGLRRSYADAFIGEVLPADRFILPRYYDGQLRWSRPAGGGELTVHGFFSDDRIVAWGGTDFRQRFARFGARWQRSRGGTTVSILPWAGVGRTSVHFVREHTEDRPDLPQRMRLDRNPIGFRGEVRRDTSWGHVAAGVDVQGAYVEMEQPLDEDSPAHVVDDGAYLDGGLWIEGRWRIDGGKLTIKPGLRADYLGVASSYVLEPRLVTTHELTSWLTLRESFGFHHQPPGPVMAVNWDRQFDRWVGDAFDPTGKVVQGIHTSVGARIALPAAVVSSITAYHVRRRGNEDAGSPLELAHWIGSDATHDMPFASGLNLMLENVMSEEFGGLAYDTRRGAGLEVSLQRRTDRWLMWMSYTLASAESRPTGPSRHSWSPTDMDQTHNLNAVASVQLGGWRIGARFRYTTGLPYTPRLRNPDGTIDYDGRINSVRLPAFTSLDARIDRRWRRGWGTLSGFLDIQNVTNNRNPEGVYYLQDTSVDPIYQPGLPILPMIGLAYQPPD